MKLCEGPRRRRLFLLLSEWPDILSCRARTRELPDHYPFVVQKAYITEFVKQWQQPSFALFDAVYDILKKDVENIVNRHFTQMGRGRLKQSVLYVHLALRANPKCFSLIKG